MRQTIVSLTSFIFSISLFAQIEDLKLEYPEEDVITNVLEHHIKIRTASGNLNVIHEVFKQNAFLNTDGLEYSNESIYHDTFNEIVEINAGTQNVVKGKLKNTPVKEFHDNNVLIRGIFYNDQKEKKVRFPNVKENSLTYLKYKKKVKDIHFLPSLIFLRTLLERPN